MEYVIHTIQSTIDRTFFSYLLVKGDVQFSKSYPSDLLDDHTHVTTGPKGKWFPTLESSINELRKTVRRQISSLEKNPDLRPSQTRRLDILRGWLATNP